MRQLHVPPSPPERNVDLPGNPAAPLDQAAGNIMDVEMLYEDADWELRAPGDDADEQGDNVDLERVSERTQEQVWRGRRYRTTVEEVEDEDDEEFVRPVRRGEEEDPFLEMPQPEQSSARHAREVPIEDDSEDEYEAISVWDQLGEALIRAGIVSV
ncbi:hypothetical protein C8Q76DRAFT_695374 [Earliella scabrosa]|nr:hypothetical protein C8Q76DRAFT_695374 [Earliella scabrosa]